MTSYPDLTLSTPDRCAFGGISCGSMLVEAKVPSHDQDRTL